MRHLVEGGRGRGDGETGSSRAFYVLTQKSINTFTSGCRTVENSGEKTTDVWVFGGDPGPSWRALTFGDEAAVRGGFAALHEGYQGPPGCDGEGAQPSTWAARKSVPVSPARGIRGRERRRGVRHVRVRGVLQKPWCSPRARRTLREGRERQHEREEAPRTRARRTRRTWRAGVRARGSARRVGEGRDKTDDKSNITSVPFRCGDESSCAN